MTADTVTTKMLFGRPLAALLLAQVRAQVQAMPHPPRLAIVQVGNNPASNAYVRNKLLACNQVGIEGEHVALREDEGERILHNVVKGLCADPDVHAVIVQTPLPPGWNVRAALDAVPAEKDIDGLSQESAARRRAGRLDCLWPATPLGIVRLLDFAGVSLAGARMAVIGKGMVVGAPLQEILLAAGADVTSIDRSTPHQASLCAQADVLIVAAGVPALVTRDWVKPGAIVLDVGISRVDHHGRTLLVGDVDRNSVEGHARLLTPVPGGIGPLTVASLLTNVVDAVCLQYGRSKMRWQLDDVDARRHSGLMGKG